jgi:transcriptional regulator with XRE-family HTH domain
MDYNKIEILRKQKGMSKKELYEKLGMSNQGYCDMVKDQTMKIKTLEKLSEIFKVTVCSWFEDNVHEYQENLISEDRAKYVLIDQLKIKDQQIEFLQETIRDMKRK